VLGPTAVVTGFVAHRGIRASGNALRGARLAWWGILTGAVGLIVSVIFLINALANMHPMP